MVTVPPLGGDDAGFTVNVSVVKELSVIVTVNVPIQPRLSRTMTVSVAAIAGSSTV